MAKRYKLRTGRVAAAISCFLLLFMIIVLSSVSHGSDSEKTRPAAGTVTMSYTSSCTTTSVTVTSTTSTLPVTTTSVPYIDCPEHIAAAVWSQDEQRLLYGDNIHARTAPASLTKLLTAVTALRYVPKDQVFTVGSEQWLVQPYSSLAYLSIGSRLTLYDLITGMLMASGNDAAYTVAVSVARARMPGSNMTDEEAVSFFCRMMNEIASEIGMEESCFVNPDGWDDERQYTTVSDLIRLADYACSIPEIRDITGTLQKDITAVSGEYYNWTNSNLLLSPYSEYYCADATGMKTGTTPDAGYCLIASFIKNEKKYLTIALGCNSDPERYELSHRLYDLIQ